MKMAPLSFRLLALAWFGGLVAPLLAAPQPVFFGTGGPGARGIYRASFDSETGALTTAELAAEVGSPGFLALHPRGGVLYAAAEGAAGPGVVAYRLGSDGLLGLLSSAATGDGGAAHLAVHPSGRFLLTAQYGGGSTALFPLDADGRPGEATVHEHQGGSGVVKGRQEAPHPHWCGFSPDGRFALVPDLGMDGIVIYAVDAGAPSITRHGFAASVPGGGPRHLRFSVDGKHIYLLNELSLSVTVFAWNAEAGTAEQLGTTPALSEETKAGEATNSAAEILVHPGGPFVYSSNRGHDSVTVYRAGDAGRTLEVVQVQPIRGAVPRNIALDPAARWLLAAGADSNTVSVHAIDQATGKLTYRTRGVINVPAPICILFAP
jgi:6-phosphogluconolactonase